MQSIEAIERAADAANVPITHIGARMGKPANYVSVAKSRGSVPKCDTMAAMAEVLGYRLALIPAESVPSDALVIDPAE